MLVDDRLVGLVVKASASRTVFVSYLLRVDFSESSHTNDLKIGDPVATMPAPGVKGSVLGLVGPVSVYCDLGEVDSINLQLLS